MLLFRISFAAALIASLSVAHAKAQPRPVSAGRALFISPMGEPFRGESRKDLLRSWFDAADANRDGAISVVELQSDGERFYALLNTNKDREIDPNELRHYEERVVPEIKVGIAAAPVASSSDNPNASKSKLESLRRGAGVYGLLATPNPVAGADLNFNRGISPEEFSRAARERFKLLDANRDGQLRFDELPSLPARL